MKCLLDMNLSPRLCAILQAEGWDSLHWSEVGDATAPDREIMDYASRDRRVVLTHDLDFGAMLAATKAAGPSVVQVRTQDIRPETLAPSLVPLLRQFESELEIGALLILDETKSRVRLLPLGR
jgi:predicted nuclease of predicted toxin-antitoxin system